ncbi:GxxExxY protein [Sporomusa sp. KB1]|jgi:GxxExxY protein|uniref:GxxExxY protein n=1 Tax=Sporomusa sp. KB1 TaxID=943346 RepID=UPI0011A3D583|nr:GxxExxY protein [Sporomusa sp. KB1]TWH51616.1 GxxExxY protein [Sporomusa sp. KB1]TWH52195.1 GxxExxY protein [Sporomusa sp. KB1]
MAKEMNSDLNMNRLTGLVIGAAVEVHRMLGPGYLESVYEEALSAEFTMQNIPFERQKTISINYKGFPVGESRLDFLVDSQLIVELKAVENLAPIHKAQVLSYMKATGYKIALLINFNVVLLKNGINRIILTE